MPSPDIGRDLLAVVAPVLVGSPFEHRARWQSAVVIIRRDERRVTSRGDFAHWLAANDLRAAANECLSRRVAAGRILVWVEADEDVGACAGFVLFDLASALQSDRMQCARNRACAEKVNS